MQSWNNKTANEKSERESKTLTQIRMQTQHTKNYGIQQKLF
jgi:hypothetical protein